MVGKERADFAVSDFGGHKNLFVRVRRSAPMVVGKLLPTLSWNFESVNWWRVRILVIVGFVLLYLMAPVFNLHFIDWAALELG